MAKKDSKPVSPTINKGSVKAQWIPKKQGNVKGTVKESEKKKEVTDHTGPRTEQ